VTRSDGIHSGRLEVVLNDDERIHVNFNGFNPITSELARFSADGNNEGTTCPSTSFGRNIGIGLMTILVWLFVF